MTVRLLQVAQQELDEAIVSYNGESPGLGDTSTHDRLMKEFEAAL